MASRASAAARLSGTQRNCADVADQLVASQVMGLFAPDHMHFDADRATDAGGEPSLAEMTDESDRDSLEETAKVISCWSKAAGSTTAITPAMRIAR